MNVDLKYPRTYHLPSSPGLQNDDRRLPRLDGYKGRVVVATEKMDGEGSTLTREKTYPRSPDGRPHPSRSWIKAYHAHRSEEHTSELQSLMRNSYAVFCL